MAFLLVSMLMLIVYQQMYNALSAHLRDTRALTPQAYGMPLGICADTVVLFQFWVARKTRPSALMLIVLVSTLFYLVGFSTYGFVTSYALFLVGILLITIGEMVMMPVGQALVECLAPTAMRGRTWQYSVCLGRSLLLWAPGLPG
jgi:hypothetical protein